LREEGYESDLADVGGFAAHVGAGSAGESIRWVLCCYWLGMGGLERGRCDSMDMCFITYIRRARVAGEEGSEGPLEREVLLGM